MAKKISQLPAAAGVTGDDLVPIVDNADATTKKATVDQLHAEHEADADPHPGYQLESTLEESVEDIVGGMVTGNTEDGVTVTYEDSDGTLDFVNTDKGSSAVSTHEGAADPHPTYFKAGEDAADLGSGAATDGQVLTADGAGGAAWESPSGGNDFGYAKILSSVGKVYEGTMWDPAGSAAMNLGMGGAALATHWQNLYPQIQMGRTDVVDGPYLPTNTVVEIALTVMCKANGATGSITPFEGPGWGSMTYFGDSHATKPSNIEIVTTRDSDGGTDTDTLSDWVEEETTFWEFIFTVKANSATATHRIFDLVVKRNGTTVLTKTSRRTAISQTATGGKINRTAGGGTTSISCMPMGPPSFRITLP